jgi:hypothetical protein
MLVRIYGAAAYDDNTRLVVTDSQSNIGKFQLDLLARPNNKAKYYNMPSLYEAEVG